MFCWKSGVCAGFGKSFLDTWSSDSVGSGWIAGWRRTRISADLCGIGIPSGSTILWTGSDHEIAVDSYVLS